MANSWYRMLGVWLAVWAALELVAQHSWALGVLALGLMAAHIADCILKGLQNTRQRKNMQDLATKAVFVTGEFFHFSNITTGSTYRSGHLLYPFNRNCSYKIVKTIEIRIVAHQFFACTNYSNIS